jgi:molybdopterin converting factor small subunit
MKVRVQFFAQLRDAIRTSETEVDLSEGARVEDLLCELYTRTPALRAWDNSILIGAGVEFVDRQHVLQPNEEIAIMPPVQGG